MPVAIPVSGCGGLNSLTGGTAIVESDRMTAGLGSACVPMFRTAIPTLVEQISC